MLSDFAEWLFDFVYDSAQDLFALLLEGVAAVLDAIPVPSWLAGADPFASLDAGVVFFAEAFQIPEGIAIILGAYFIRWLTRRVPIVG